MENPKILVVDDEDDIRKDLCRDLIKEGYDAREAADAIEAMRLMTESFSVIIADLRMPKMDGLDFIKAVSKDHPEIQIIIITGHGGEQDAIEAVRLHVFDYITKGELTIDRLLESVEKAVIKYKTLPKLQGGLDSFKKYAKDDATVKTIRELTSKITESLGNDISQQRG